LKTVKEQLENAYLEKENTVSQKEEELKLLVTSFYEIVIRQKVFEKIAERQKTIVK